MGQLIRENNAVDNFTMLYGYDKAGNLAIKSLQSYTTGYTDILFGSNLTLYNYSDSTWGDLLVSYDGMPISYDTIGNPLNWRNSSSMTWEGRRLASQTLNNGDTLTYVYNSDGIRTQKEFYDDSIGEFYTYEYILDGNRIISETVYMGITRLYTMNYFYDETGVAGFEFEGAEFYYLKNLQGDIIEILNSNGESVVQYTYDAWGKVISVTGTLKDGIGKYNPFRYRGYYYDTETGLYYLNSRYYDPEVCRFISPDTIAVLSANTYAITDKNLFAYCDNNPVMRYDNGGEFWDTIFDVVSLVVSVVDVISDPTDTGAWVGLACDVVDVAIPFVGILGLKFYPSKEIINVITGYTFEKDSDIVIAAKKR